MLSSAKMLFGMGPGSKYDPIKANIVDSDEEEKNPSENTQYVGPVFSGSTEAGDG